LSTVVTKLGIWAFGVTSSRFFGRGDESLLAVAPSRQDDAFTMSGVPPDDGRREAENETQNSLGLVEGTSQGEESPI